MTRRRKRAAPSSRAARAFAELDRTSVRLLRILPASHGLDCRAGCNHCCRQQVSVTALEVFELAAELRRTLDPAALQRRRERVRAVAEDVRGKTPAEHRGTLCPLDDEGRCVAYPSRPLLCRGANSFDAASCATPGAPVPTYAALNDAAQAALERLDDRSAEITGRREMLELSGALAIALELPDAEQRWRSGEIVFARATHAWLENDRLVHWRR